MATTYTWTGASTGALSTAGNWSPSGPPGDTDTALFPITCTNAPSTSMDGLSDTLALIHVAAGCTYSIGSSGNELKVKCARVVHLGAADFWYDTDANTSDHNIILAPAANGSSNIVCAASTTSGQIYCLSGTVGITGSGAEDMLVVDQLNGREANVTVANTVGTFTDVIQRAGMCKSGNAMTRLFICGGRHEKLTTEEAATVVQTGGTVVWDATDTVTLYEALGGMVDFTRAGKALTVTTFVQGPNADVVRSADLTTFTAHIEMQDFA